MSVWTVTSDSVNSRNCRVIRERATGEWKGAGEFYTGLTQGARVIVDRQTCEHESFVAPHVSYSVSLAEGGAWLAVGDSLGDRVSLDEGRV